MSIPVSIVGTVFNAAEISLGVAIGTGPFTYTETTSLASSVINGLLVGAGAQVTFTSLATDPVTGVQSLVGTISGSTLGLLDGQTITGTVTGNDANDALLNATVAGLPATVLIANAVAVQPGAGSSLTVQSPLAGVTFNPACYCAGTLIRTERGEVPVEDLQIGERVLTVAAGAQPIRWIGMRSYAGRFLAGHDDLLPIRIRAGALADGVPARDLLVSPKHAMLLDGVLVPAALLVNGITITREYGVARVDYFHVELPEHHAIWAEDAPSETFVDDDSRGMFGNAHTYSELYPGAPAGTPALYCAPRVEGGLHLQAIRDGINARIAVSARAA